MFGTTAIFLGTDHRQVTHRSPPDRQTDEDTVPSAGHLQPPAQRFHKTTPFGDYELFCGRQQHMQGVCLS